MAAIAEILVRVAQLAANHPEIAEIDINPLLADAEGVIAVDARIHVAATAVSGAARLAIAPYPREYVTAERLLDGTPIRVRPVRPDDEPLLQDILGHMTPADQRFRFFMPMRALSRQLGARLSQVDYDREMALMAQTPDGKTALGVARYSADPDNRCAEYAIALRSDWKARGLGYLLMRRLIEVARQRGVGALVGDVLRDNGPMLDLCQYLGFSVALNHDDFGAFRLTLDLATPVPKL
jgi:acetyltransferase